MIRFIAIALIAFLLPGIVFYLWRIFAPERFGGSPAMARGDWRPMPWRRLAWTGLVLTAVTFAVMVSIEGERAPPSVLLQGVQPRSADR